MLPIPGRGQRALVSTVVEDELGLSVYMSEKISARQPCEKRASVVCTGKQSGFFEGWGSVFCLLILMLLYGCTADSEKHQVGLSYSHFLNWILKNVGVYWKVVHSSGVLALDIQMHVLLF